MFNLGWLEVGLIILIAVIIFGPKRIPALGAAFGKTLRSFKEGVQENPSQDSEDDR